MEFSLKDTPAYRPIPRIIRAQRKLLGLSQSRLASIMGITQSHLSRIETGSAQKLDAMAFVQFCQYARLDSAKVSSGFIDRNLPLSQLVTSNYEGGIELPPAFSLSRGTAMRAVVAYLKTFARLHGADKVPELFRHLGMDMDLLWVLDNQTNLQFVHKIVEHTFTSRIILQEDVRLAVDPVTYIKMRELAESQTAPPLTDLYTCIRNFAAACAQFDINYGYRALGGYRNVADLEVPPNDHIRDWNLGAQSSRFIDEYKKEVTRWYCERLPGVMRVTITEIECASRGSHRCIYRIRVF